VASSSDRPPLRVVGPLRGEGDPADQLLTMPQLRLITGRTPWRVMDVLKRGAPVRKRPKSRGGDWQFSQNDLLRWAFDELEKAPAAAEGGGESLDLEHERARLAKEQADKLERERLVVEGRLLVAESVKAALVHCFSSVNGRLGAMPAKLAHVIRPDDPRTARRHLEVAVEELRAELRAVEIQGFEVPEGGAKH
jgi:phage terminase Nu1 subunit (DNA packaging protein)